MFDLDPLDLPSNSQPWTHRSSRLHGVRERTWHLLQNIPWSLKSQDVSQWICPFCFSPAIWSIKSTKKNVDCSQSLPVIWFLLAEVTFHTHVPKYFAKPNIICKNYDTGALYAHSTSDWSSVLVKTSIISCVTQLKIKLDKTYFQTRCQSNKCKITASHPFFTASLIAWTNNHKALSSREHFCDN